MYDFLLFVHVLSAFLLMVAVVISSAYVLGSPSSSQGVTISERLWDVGGIGTLIFGVWLALRQPEYDLFDGWVVGALALWILVAAAGMPARSAVHTEPGDKSELGRGAAATWHWVRVGATVAILALMIFKPGI